MLGKRTGLSVMFVLLDFKIIKSDGATFILLKLKSNGWYVLKANQKIAVTVLRLTKNPALLVVTYLDLIC